MIFFQSLLSMQCVLQGKDVILTLYQKETESRENLLQLQYLGQVPFRPQRYGFKI
jgi:hypothetical protein